MNPKVSNVIATLDRIKKTSPVNVTVTGTIRFPDWVGLNDHIQGVAPLNNSSSATGCISGSSTDGAYFATFEATSATAAVVRAVRIWPDRPQDYDHGSGVQLLDGMLPFGVESDRSSDKAEIGFYTLANLSAPQRCYKFSMPGRKASATSITNFTDGSVEKALLASYEYDPKHMRFFLADYNQVAGTTNPWTETFLYTGGAFGGDEFQNFAMVTDTNNVIFMLGFREDEELHLYEVVTEKNPFRILDIVRRKTYTGWSGADWRNGVGAQIVDSSRIRIFGTDKDPSGSSTSYKFKVYVWS
ncbi:MAG TPA: hypothetical protein VKK31_19580 [Thermoanaerobaculia bacterium]|nr:hypothetical protein [Thermoanaerobaculia bacterium]